MEILLLVQHLRKENERGGQRSREIAESLARTNASVTALVPNVDPLTEKVAIKNLFVPWKVYRQKGNIKEYRYYVPSTPRKGITGRFLYSFIGFLNTLLFVVVNARKFDVLITTTHPLLISMTAFPAKWLNNAAVIVEVRDIPLEVAIERGIITESSLIGRVYKYFESALIGSADYVICYSKMMLELLGKRMVVGKCAVLPIGVDTTAFEEIKKSSPKDRVITLCFFGTLGKVLQFDGVFELIELLANMGLSVRLDIYGDGESKSRLESECKEKQLNVSFKEIIPKKDVIKTCAAYDFAVYPVEGGDAVSASLGNKFFDYLSAKTPMIVLGKNSEVGRIVESNNLGIAEDDVEELAFKIVSVVEEVCAKDIPTSEIFSFTEAIDKYQKKKIFSEFNAIVVSLAEGE